VNDALPWFRRQGVLSAMAVLWIVALYLLCRPYRGVRHDAMLYFGQSLLHQSSGWLQHDLFFLSNSQDRYSLFSTLFAPVLQALGLSSSEIVTLLALHVLLLFAVWRLTAGMATSVRWIAMALVLVLPHFYAAGHRFGYGEPFLTARTLAEPFALLALSAVLCGRRVLAVLTLAVATLAHPLMAFPAGLIGWRLLCEDDRRWNWAALLAIPVAALVALHFGPLGALAHRYDWQWLSIVRQEDDYVFVGTWQVQDWQEVAFDLALLWLGARDAAMPLARLAGVSIRVTIVCLLVSLFGVDLGHNILFTQLQLWRVTWIAHLVAMASLAPLMTSLWTRNDKGRLAVALLLLAAIVISSTARTAWVVGALAIASVLLSESSFEISRGFVRLGMAACVVAAVAISGVEASSYYDQIQMGAESGLMIGRVSAIPAGLPAIMLTLALVGLWPLLRPTKTSVVTGAATGLVLLALGAWQWDQRNDWAYYVEQHQGQPHPFQAAIPPNAQVYWAGDLLASWALLGRPSYFTEAQVAGALYSRETSFAAMDRLKTVWPLMQSTACHALSPTGQSQVAMKDCEPPELAAADVCHPTSGGPDFIVLASPLKAPPMASWRFQPTESAPTDYLLYDCNKIH
jgi:hypothetical protein